jgi:hypothetical protein
MTIKESGRVLPRSSAVIHAKASWAVCGWPDTIPSEQPYNKVSYRPAQQSSCYLVLGVLVPVCASTQLKCLFEWAQPTWSLINIDGGYHSWSSEFINHHTLTLPIQYSPLSLNCPARSRIIQQEHVDNIFHIGPPS